MSSIFTPADLGQKLKGLFRRGPERLVIRGGTLKAGDIERGLERTEQGGRPAISVISAENVTYAELLELSTTIPHPLVSCSTVERLARMGFPEVLPTGKHPHHDVIFEDDWRETDAINRFRRAFDPAVHRSLL